MSTSAARIAITGSQGYLGSTAVGNGFVEIRNDRVAIVLTSQKDPLFDMNVLSDVDSMAGRLKALKPAEAKGANLQPEHKEVVKSPADRKGAVSAIPRETPEPVAPRDVNRDKSERVKLTTPAPIVGKTVRGGDAAPEHPVHEKKIQADNKDSSKSDAKDKADAKSDAKDSRKADVKDKADARDSSKSDAKDSRKDEGDRKGK